MYTYIYIYIHTYRTLISIVLFVTAVRCLGGLCALIMCTDDVADNVRDGLGMASS